MHSFIGNKQGNFSENRNDNKAKIPQDKLAVGWFALKFSPVPGGLEPEF